MIDQDGINFKVIDLKQYFYCPRIFYYQTILPDIRPITGKMKEGILVHHEEDDREQRRQLQTYGLTDGERIFHHRLQSTTYRLSGEIDLLIKTEDELIPIDFKNATKPSTHYKRQLAAYALMLRADGNHQLPIKRGFLYLIPERKAVEVTFAPRLLNEVRDGLNEMASITVSQYMPEATPQRGKCVDCEFRRFCNDVL